jgi:ribosomal protein L31E
MFTPNPNFNKNIREDEINIENSISKKILEQGNTKGNYYHIPKVIQE